MSSRDKPPVRTARRWLTAATALFGCLAVLPWLTPFGPLTGGPVGTAAALLVTIVPGLVLLSASRRAELLDGLRKALFLLAISILLTAAGNLLRFIDAVGAHAPPLAGLDLATTVAIWALGLAALVLIPLSPPAPGARWRIATDVTIAVLGMSLAVVAIWTLPGIRMAPPAAHVKLVLYNAMEAANLVVLNLILVRGPLRPIRRAIYWLSATIVIETIYLIALQYAVGRQAQDFRLANSLFFLDYLGYLYAGSFFLLDPQPERDTPLLPESLRAFNPLPIASVLGVGALLILAALRPRDPALLPLAAGLVVLALLLLFRLVGATAENLRLLREEAALERRVSAEKMELMGRLAGGCAHVINNLMTVVMGRAELALERAGRAPGVRENLDAVTDAARRASGLAERLLSASGRRMREQRQVRALDVVLSRRETLVRAAGPDRTVAWDLAEGNALVAPSDLEAVLLELVSNAADAAGPGGRIVIRVRDEVLDAPPDGMFLAVRPGPFSIVEVEDDGPGIARADLSRVFEPFFTTRPPHEGRGLGLSVVHGILASRGGGVLLDSRPGAGTRVRVYLPWGAETLP